MTGILNKKEFGDYQTPIYFTNTICDFIKHNIVKSPNCIIEPTCGIGNFLYSAKNYFTAQKLIGIDVNTKYTKEASDLLGNEVSIYNGNFFDFNFEKIIKKIPKSQTTLIIGNPPWVNNSTLSKINGSNLPQKYNLKRLNGIEAMTGSSNFDICESIILKIIEAFKNRNAILALICKMTVAKNVFCELKRTNTNFFNAKIFTFDAKKIFNVSVDACLFTVKLTSKKISDDYCEVSSLSTPNILTSKFGIIKGRLYSNIDNSLQKIDGKSCFQWRQGVKHDCAKIMEFDLKGNSFFNGRNDCVNIEKSLLYPLIKSSKIKEYIISNTTKYVLIPQRKINDSTDYIMKDFPRTWKYLSSNLSSFNSRKSSIYKKAPNFAIFGIGDYSFCKYKVGISGFYKEPMFALLSSQKPAMMDDTCYFIGFNDFDMAYIAMVLLNSDIVQKFLKGIAFINSKRPYTKKILERIDFKKLTEVIDFDLLKETEKSLLNKDIITPKNFKKFQLLISEMEN